MNVLMVSLDRNSFHPGDPARSRLAGYGEVFDELHIIVYAKRSLGLAPQKIADNVWLYPTGSASRLSYIPDALRIAKGIGARFSIVSGQDAGETGIAAWLIARALRTPLQLQDHADVFDPWFARESLGNRMRVLLARFLLPRADCLRVVLPRMKARIAARYPRLADRIDVLPVFTDTRSVTGAVPSFDLHARYPRFTTVMLMATRIVPQKHIGFALRAFAEARVPESGLVIVGEGRSLERIVAEAGRLGLADRVVFVPWEKDLAAYYQTADVFLLSSRYESYCRTLVEAAAAGLPFVSTDVGVASLLVEGGAQGSVLPQDDLAGFAGALRAQAQAGRAPAGSGRETVAALTGATEAEYRARFRATFDRCAPAPAV